MAGYMTATWDDAELMQHYRRVPRLVRAHGRRRLSYWGRYMVKDIRRHSRVFKYRNGGATGKLIASMWTRRAAGHRGDPMQHVGWGVSHGEIMEYGPRRKFVWDIVPKGFRSDITHGRSGGGVALKRLRFMSNGKIRYARKVTRRWKNKELRQHIAPSLKRIEKGFMQDCGSIAQRVIEGRLT